MAGSSNTLDTIAALATPPGRSGVGIIRISGAGSAFIAEKILRRTLIPRYAYHGYFFDQNHQAVDEGIALFFKAPSSFTGEDVLELQAHGGPIVLDGLLKTVLSYGARMAEPGEFTERAFLNGKIDLVQAEAIADLINATSERAARSAVLSLEGEFSKRIHHLRDQLIRLRVEVEATIDFPDEEIGDLNKEKISDALKNLIQELDGIAETAKQGTLLQEGLSVVIAGEPNVGKSSLLNALSGKETAIVTDIAGTTRDVLREYIHLDGMPLHIMDTAGLRHSTNDVIEREGIRRAWQEIERADRILFMVDASKVKERDPKKICPEFFDKFKDNFPLVTLIRNKIDLIGETPCLKKEGDFSEIYLSIKKNQGLDLLKHHLKESVGYQSNTEGLFIARRRHLDALERAKESLLKGKKQFDQFYAVELLAEELRLAQEACSEITGEFSSGQLLEEIFSHFCIGK